ncbi:uncharacterized protein LOC123504295 isoform X2 [Portunus trituberculatus]|uniref:Uncharacterized protein n=1 Tax=Portunus trituberculatus TaxID=210409 RepID=A0A5B7CL64_PORTR|nr:uncharacterized protein LOC123504295 isoform X2 [Portunus trituberculatus]MPC10289.1 hypothetical protein [Portunus trituberculatus]
MKHFLRQVWHRRPYICALSTWKSQICLTRANSSATAELKSRLYPPKHLKPRHPALPPCVHVIVRLQVGLFRRGRRLQWCGFRHRSYHYWREKQTSVS